MKKMLQKIFSVKNKKNHKIIRILGIKLKFRISEKNMISSQKPVKLYDIKGQNNQIIIVENGNENIFDNIEVIDGLKIVINGSNNTIKLHKPFNLFNNVFIEIGNDTGTSGRRLQAIPFRTRYAAKTEKTLPKSG